MFSTIITELLIIFLVFAPIERLFPTHQGQKVLRPGWGTDLKHVFFSTMLIWLGNITVVAAIILAGRGFVAQEISELLLRQPVWLQFCEIVILADLGFYAVHRAMHAFPFLWRIHAVHHSIEHMDALAGHRNHPIDQLLIRNLTVAPAIILGFAPAAIALYLAIFRIHALLIHSNINLDLDFLKWIVVLPKYHHWHHAYEQEAIDKNFAAQLPIIDLIFNTAYYPANASPSGYGVNDPVPDDYIGQIAYPFRRGESQETAPAYSTQG